MKTKSTFYFRYWLALSDKKYDDIDETLRYRFRKLYQRFQNGNDGSDDWFLSSSVSYVNYEDEPTAGENMLWNRNSRGFETVLDLLQVILILAIYSHLIERFSFLRKKFLAKGRLNQSESIFYSTRKWRRSHTI